MIFLLNVGGVTEIQYLYSEDSFYYTSVVTDSFSNPSSFAVADITDDGELDLLVGTNLVFFRPIIYNCIISS